MPWLNELRQRFASIDYYWSVWVLGFNQDRQNQVLSGILGDVTNTKIAVFMGLCISLIVLYIAYSAGLLHFSTQGDPSAPAINRSAIASPAMVLSVMTVMGQTNLHSRLSSNTNTEHHSFAR